MAFMAAIVAMAGMAKTRTLLLEAMAAATKAMAATAAMSLKCHGSHGFQKKGTCFRHGCHGSHRSHGCHN